MGNKSAVKTGKFSRVTGAMSYLWLKRSIELAKSGRVNAIVTAPISKEALHLAGINYSGHTEILADLTKTKNYAMLMVSESLRAVMVTRHIPLSGVSKEITKEKITSTALLLNGFLRARYKIKNPRIGVSALNPHAGEGGILGSEEGKVIFPAVLELKKKNINVSGPLPVDSAWLKMKEGEFDLLVCMYHDQVMIPLKSICPEKIVNITCGLPFIRTSPGHGTAFDIAGRNIADERPMVEAIKAAVFLSSKK